MFIALLCPQDSETCRNLCHLVTSLSQRPSHFSNGDRALPATGPPTGAVRAWPAGDEVVIIRMMGDASSRSTGSRLCGPTICGSRRGGQSCDLARNSAPRNGDLGGINERGADFPIMSA